MSDGRRWSAVVACGLALLAGSAGGQNVVVYDDALSAGWESWSYPDPGIVLDFANPAPAHSGAASVAVSFNGPFAALSLRTSPPLATAGYDSLRFWIYGSGASTSLDLFTQATDGGAGSPVTSIAGPTGVWTQVVVPLSALGSPSQIARINWQDNTNTIQPEFYLDDIELVASASGSSSGGAREAIADRVVGQAGFGTGAAGLGAATLNGPAAVAVGPDGRLFVADYENSRVLSWTSARDFVNGAAASLVLGQTNFTSGGASNASNRFDHPEGVTVDPFGNVYVADTNNHRIMAFTPPLSNGMVRTATWGSLDPVANCAGAALTTFCYPRALASDAAGNIYLADEFHNRILIYATPLTTNTTPDQVLLGLGAPRGVAVDANGNVYASDSEGDVVREYDTPLGGDAIADRTYGSGSDGIDCFNPGVAAPTATSLACPIDLAVDAAGHLYVSDLYHNRVLAYFDPLSDNVPDAVFGQRGSFASGTANNGGLGPETIRTPLGLAFDGTGSLYLADFDNNRVLAFDGVKGDFGRDSKVDLVFRNQGSNRHMLWSMDGATRIGSSWVSPDPASASWQVVAADDFNRDNRADLVFWNASTGAVEFWMMNGAARVGAAQPISAPTLATTWKLAATGDFNRDARPDLLWRNTATQKLTLWTMNGVQQLGTLTPTPDQAVNVNWEVVAALDYNKDGNRDLLWYNYSSGKIVLWLMDANLARISGNFTNPANAGDANWKVYAGGDYGVGTSGLFATNDIVWRNATSGRLVVWQMDDAGNRTFGWFTTPDGPATNPDGTPTPMTDWALVGPR